MARLLTDSPAKHTERCRVMEFSRADIIRMLRIKCESMGICAGPAMRYVLHGIEGNKNLTLAIHGDGVDDTRRKYAE